ncbi:CCAAT/enhancer-binding protein gamma-like [Physella acuta]|uniref:CCAAT/enhancer-binding protein gamma-like n=1 Tax=Physella acuta TaxID=109671 RepID=UPI0027DB06C2|nr:CCAAT/enhancer-binding protein gamma-like [Physella acuta]
MPPKKTYESYDSESEGDSQSGKKRGSKRQKLDKNSDEYKRRRERNNVAVRKSREASRQKAKDTMERVARLREENKALEQKATILNKELGVLRDLFLTHATATAAVQSKTFLKKENDGDISETSIKSESNSSDHLHHFFTSN